MLERLAAVRNSHSVARPDKRPRPTRQTSRKSGSQGPKPNDGLDRAVPVRESGFLTAFPESERAAREAVWTEPSSYSSIGPFG